MFKSSKNSVRFPVHQPYLGKRVRTNEITIHSQLIELDNTSSYEKRTILVNMVSMWCPVCDDQRLIMYFTKDGVLNCNMSVINPENLMICKDCYLKLMNNAFSPAERYIYERCLGGH